MSRPVSSLTVAVTIAIVSSACATAETRHHDHEISSMLMGLAEQSALQEVHAVKAVFRLVNVEDMLITMAVRSRDFTVADHFLRSTRCNNLSDEACRGEIMSSSPALVAVLLAYEDGDCGALAAIYGHYSGLQVRPKHKEKCPELRKD